LSICIREGQLPMIPAHYLDLMWLVDMCTVIVGMRIVLVEIGLSAILLPSIFSNEILCSENDRNWS
jgi:hypothetical protein